MMKTNYQQILDNILASLDKNKHYNLLLHSCCGPCSSYVIEYLSNYFDITVFYYNPNIAPIDEYLKRKNEQLKLINEIKTKNKVCFLDCDYEGNKFDEIAKGLESEPERGKRCSKCYFLRLEKVAQVAKENNFDFFGTTLTVSPYKDSERINNMGRLLESKYKISYLFSDFKKKNGYKRSIELAKQYNLYRQDYCGCIYSKEESYSKRGKTNQFNIN